MELVLVLDLKTLSQDQIQQRFVEQGAGVRPQSLVPRHGSTALRGAHAGVGPLSLPERSSLASSSGHDLRSGWQRHVLADGSGDWYKVLTDEEAKKDEDDVEQEEEEDDLRHRSWSMWRSSRLKLSGAD